MNKQYTLKLNAGAYIILTLMLASYLVYGGGTLFFTLFLTFLTYVLLTGIKGTQQKPSTPVATVSMILFSLVLGFIFFLGIMMMFLGMMFR